MTSCVQHDKLLWTFSFIKFPKVVACSEQDKYFHYMPMNLNLLLVLFLLLFHLSSESVLSLSLAVQIIFKLLVFVYTYAGSEVSVGPTVHHVDMWEAQSPAGRNLVYNGLPRLRHSWKLQGNVDQTDAHHSPRGQGLNSSPLQKRVKKSHVWNSDSFSSY